MCTPFYYKNDFLFVREDSKFVSMEGKTICLTSGYSYPEEITSSSKVKYEYASSDSSCFGMLEKKRVDGVICEGFSAAAALERSNIKNVIISGNPFPPQPVYFNFSKTEKGKTFSKIFSNKSSNVGEELLSK